MKHSNQLNPFESPATNRPQEASQEAQALKKLEKKAWNIGNDAEKAVIVRLIPILSLVFILRLVQWYQLQPQVAGNTAIDRLIRRKFMNAKIRLWIAVLIWPGAILAVAVYLSLT